MGKAKQIIVKPIKSNIAREFVKKHHYSGKVVANSNLHFGCFLNGVLGGVMQFGSSLDKRKVQGLVENTGWNEFLELNRMAFSPLLPKNSESRCIAIAIRLIKKHYPHIKWIISFADGCQCGDGTIYRASGFILTKVQKSKQIIQTPKGNIFTAMSLTLCGNPARLTLLNELGLKDDGSSSIKPFLNNGCKYIEGNMLRYIYLIDKSCKITVPILPFSKIDELNAGMYKGKKISLEDRRV